MLDRLLSRGNFEVLKQATTWGDWPGDSAPTWAGPSVTPMSSMQLLTVYGCVKLIADSISTLPIDCFSAQAGGGAKEFTPPVWLKQPTVDLDFTDWCTQVLMSLLLQGNAYIRVYRSDTSYSIVELVPLDPSKITVRREGGAKVYYVNGIPFTGELLHIKGLMFPGADVGLSPVEMARQTIGLGLATQEYGAKFFDSDGNMPGVIEMTKVMQPDQKRAMASMWKRNRSRAGKGLPGVLDDGATWKPTGVTNEAAQFLETRQFTDAQIAGQMFLIDPSELGIPVQGTSLTYANLSERNVRLVQRPLLPWIIRLEKALSSLLPQPRYVKLNVDGLQRGDMKSRLQGYEIAARINTSAVSLGMPPFQTSEEMRLFEDWNPITGWIPPATPVAVPAPVAPNV